MNLKNRKVMLLVFLLLYTVFVLGLSFISHQFLIDNFKRLETTKNSKDINLILSGIATMMKQVKQLANDYSYSDDTYEFIKYNNKSSVNNFIKTTNQQTTDYLLQDLDFVVYTNLQNQVVYSKYNNKHQFMSDTKAFEQKILKTTKSKDEFNTIAKIDSNIFFLTKAKVLKTNKTGNHNGFIYAGRVITKNTFLHENNFFAKIDIDTLSNAPKYTTKLRDNEYSIEEEAFNVNIFSFNENNEYYLNTIEFYDIFNNYIFSLHTQNILEILKSGKSSIYLYNIAVAVLLFIVFFVLLHIQDTLTKSNQLLEKQVKDRTKKLDEYVNIVNKYVTTSSTDLDGNITHVSEAFCKISGYSKEELIGKNHRIVKHPDMDPAAFEELWDTISQDKKWVGEMKNKKKNGEAYWVLANIDPIFNDDGKKIGYTSIRQEITDKKRIEKLSVTDKLTQLYNRVRLEEIFTIEIAKFHRYHTHFSIILIDIDHFKSVNDTYGHNVGDTLLKEIADVLKSSVRVEDVVGRWGGEEFIILSNNYTVEGVLQLAEKIRKNIESYDFTTVGHKTASLGIGILNKEDTQESLIYRADKSLYHAKKTGRNKVCLH